MYDQFLCEYPNNKFTDKSLKDRLWKTLKELRTGTLNEEGSKKVVM